MASPVILDGDLLLFDPLFGNCTVTLVTPPPQVSIKGSGYATIDSKKVAVQGDEIKVQFLATYVTPTHSIPGQGTVTIKALDSSQFAPNVGSDLPVILKGSASFTALFIPTSPAKEPPFNTPDPNIGPSLGSGQFQTSQTWVTVG